MTELPAPALPPRNIVAGVASGNQQMIRWFEDVTTVARTVIPDGDKGDVTVSSQGSVWTVDAGAITLAKIEAAAVSYLLDRVNHTGTQAQSTVTGLVSDLAGKQPLDGDLTSLAAASATNAIYYRSAADTWSPVTIGANLTFSAGTLAATGGGGGGGSPLLGWFI